MAEEKNGRISECVPGSKPCKIVSTPLNASKNVWYEYLCVQKMSEEATVPSRGSTGAAGYDLFAAEPGIVPARGQLLVHTKLKISFPPGVYARIASRSGLSLIHSIEVGAGVIDSDYRGEIMVILRNHSDIPYLFDTKKAIAQLILERNLVVPIKEIKDQSHIFGTTARGDGGFGSSDRG
jgi:dUTP pyrophosphatase